MRRPQHFCRCQPRSPTTRPDEGAGALGARVEAGVESVLRIIVIMHIPKLRVVRLAPPAPKRQLHCPVQSDMSPQTLAAQLTTEGRCVLDITTIKATIDEHLGGEGHTSCAPLNVGLSGVHAIGGAGVDVELGPCGGQQRPDRVHKQLIEVHSIPAAACEACMNIQR
jgi:hypothetical protein